jgi:hypothetical protein
MNDSVNEQFEELCGIYPQLKLVEMTDGKYEINGTINMDAIYEGMRLFDRYEIKMQIPPTYPTEFPKAYLDKSVLPQEFQHFYEDGELCLGVENDMWDKFERNPTLLHFFEEFVISYLYSVTYFKRFYDFPFGERPHGIDGIIEYYYEKFQIDNHRALFGILISIYKQKYRGHQPCPCGSGEKGRKCHGSMIIAAITSKRRHIYGRDLAHLITEEKLLNEARRAYACQSASR